MPEVEDITLIGKWDLKKLCFSDGASSCTIDDMWDADYSEIVTFFESGEFSINRDGEDCQGTFTTPRENGILLKAGGDPCFFSEIEYSILSQTADTLIMSPLCIEGCPMMYTRSE